MASGSTQPPVVHTLPNGIRIVTETVPHCSSVSIGLTLVQGSRHEEEGNNGMTHFCEHLLFKGTPTRDWRQIARAINLLGGQFNAVTSTDWVRVYGSVIPQDVAEALALMTEMMIEPTFPESEVERERNVILEEIAMYEDIPEDLCQENLTRALLLPHPLGRPVIGTAELVGSYSAKALKDYWTSHLVPGDLILSAAGNLDADALLAEAERVLGGMKGKAAPKGGLTPVKAASTHSLVERELEQVNFAFAVAGPSRQAAERFGWAVYDSILGGGMGSRLFDEVREKRGLAYGVGSAINAMDRAGYLSVSGSTRPETAATAIEVCLDVVEELAKTGPTEDELVIAKRQLERSVLLGADSIGSKAGVNADRLMYGLEYLGPQRIIERILAVTHEDVRGIAEQVVKAGPPAVSLVGPLAEAPNLDKALKRVGQIR